MSKQFSVEQKPLLSILASMQPICSKRTTVDTTTSILFQISYRELVLKSTDLEISLQASCHISESNFTYAESFLVSGKRIFDVIREFDGTVIFTLKENQLFIASGSVKLALNIQDAQNFPPFPERIENLMHIDTGIISRMLDAVSFLIPQNNTNSALNGLYLEIDARELKMTTTDGHSLAQVKSAQYTLPESKSWLLPVERYLNLKKLLNRLRKQPFLLAYVVIK